MNYAHIKTYAPRYSDFDFKDELKLSSLLEVVQESACLSADELGFGYDALRPQGYGFIIVGTHCELYRPLQLGEEIAVETWPLPPRHVFFERHYFLRGARGEEIARVASRWCLVDLKNFSLLTPDRLGETHAKCPYRKERALEISAWKIPRIQEGYHVRDFTLGNSDCDHYLHANNAKYADFFLNCFRMEELREMHLRSFRIAYAKQVREGEKLVFMRRDDADGSTLEALDEGGNLCTQMRLWYQRRNA